MLRKDGLLIIRIRFIDSKIGIDLLSILSRMFKKVIIGQPELYYDQAIICENLIQPYGLDDNIISKIDKYCGVSTDFKIYLNSIFIQNREPIINKVKESILLYIYSVLLFIFFNVSCDNLIIP